MTSVVQPAGLVSTSVGTAATPAVVIDTSVWVSWLVRTDANHSATQTWMTLFRATGGVLVAPDLLAVEVAASISRRSGSPSLARQAVRDLRRLHLMHLVPADPILMEEATDLAANLGIRGGDAVFTALATRLGMPLLTWDQDQQRRAASIIPAYTPITYPF